MNSMEPRLAYCTNVAPAESVDALVAGLGGLWRDVAQRAGERGRLGLGLWLRDRVAAELAQSKGSRERVRAALDAGGLELVTINAFPARAFHAPVVKEAVYEPAWDDPDRVAFTLDVAAAVSGLVPPGTDITLSTLPLGFPKWDADRVDRAVTRLVQVARELDDLAYATGVEVRLALEPEPCCVLETTAEAIAFFEERLRPGARLAGAEDAAARRLGVCLDLCHTLVEHEDPIESFQTYNETGVPVFKVQVSAALEVPDPADPIQRERLGAFVEERWLHQVGVAPGRVLPDLPDALADPSLTAHAPWRVHFHVPLDQAEVGGLPTTRPAVARFLAHVRTLDAPPVLELETYTWSVVPGAAADLADNVAREIRWARGQLEGA
jgi:sugar phosphate isomerase/epimerase